MFIRLDVFAEMLKTTPDELLHAARSTGELEGLTLPSRTHIRGALMMFDYEEAVKFAARWHARDLPPARPDGDSFAEDLPLVPLTALAEQAGIAPLVLYEAVITGKKLGGIRPPVPSVHKPRLFFSADAASHFVQRYRERRR